MIDPIEAPIPYFWLRNDDEDVDAIEINSTTKSLREFMIFIMKNPEELGVHFVVDTDGVILKCVEPEHKIKLHPGLPIPGLIGITLIGEFSDKQLSELLNLCCELCSNYSIPLNEIEVSIENFPIFDFLNSLGSSIITSLMMEPEQ